MSGVIWDDDEPTLHAWTRCPCDDCADERSLQRAKAVDPERHETH